MKQFSLEEFKKNPNRKVVTRDGRPVRIICTDANGDYPVVALIKDKKRDQPETYTPDGVFFPDEETSRDLFFDAATKKGFVNLYRTEKGMIIFGNVRETKEEALDELEKAANTCKHIDTIQIEWEE